MMVHSQRILLRQIENEVRVSGADDKWLLSANAGANAEENRKSNAEYYCVPRCLPCSKHNDLLTELISSAGRQEEEVAAHH